CSFTLSRGAVVKNRREFLKTGLAAACVSPISFVRTLAAAPIADSRIEVLLNEPQGTISPNIYGHFVEHLGGVVYDGLWVGPQSKVPNVNGLRRDVLEHMSKIKAPVVRYPGGCFADSYDWRDGIGPVEKRPRRTNFWNNADSEKSPSNHRFEPNEFGTNEFVRFCKLIGAQPYLAANLRSLPATAFQHWGRTVIHRQAARRTPISGQLRATPHPSMSFSGEWATNPGVAAATLPPKNMPSNFAATPLGFRTTANRFRSLRPVQAVKNGSGRANSSR